MISEKEFELINILVDNTSSTQRALASQTQLSLGMVNLLLKRLVMKGYLRVRQLDRRRVQYLLTPNGFAEKAKKSYRYTLKTISSLKTLRAGLQEILRKACPPDTRHFLLVGQGDLCDLMEIILREMESAGVTFERVNRWPQRATTGTFLLHSDNFSAPRKSDLPSVNLVEALAGTIVPGRFTQDEPLV